MKYFMIDEHNNKVEITLKECSSSEMIFEKVINSVVISTEEFVGDVINIATNSEISFKRTIDKLHRSLNSTHTSWVFDSTFSDEDCKEFMEIVNECIDYAHNTNDIHSPFYVNKLHTIGNARLALNNMFPNW